MVSEAADRPVPTTPGGWLGPLLAITLLQGMGGLLLQMFPTLAPLLGATYGYGETAIGYLVALTMASAVVCLAASGAFIKELGPIRAIQASAVLGAVAAALVAVPFAVVPVLAAALFGLAYGTNTPAGSDVLHRIAPPRHRSLVFSVKQTAVPLGGAAAGVLFPAAAHLGGLPAAGFTAAALLILAAVLAQTVRERIDALVRVPGRRRLAASLSPHNLMIPLRAMSAGDGLLRVALISGCLTVSQGAMGAFMVTFYVNAMGFGLKEAGALFAFMQLGGIGGRVLAGMLADRLQSAAVVVRLAAAGTMATLVTLAAIPKDTPQALLVALSLAIGIFTSGWNGVQLAEIARRAPPGRVAEASAGATIVIFIGFLAGPTLFALVLAGTRSFTVALLTLCVLPASALALSLAAGGDPER